MRPEYTVFARVITDHPDADCLLVIQQCMRKSGGRMDPNEIAEWWNQWRVLLPMQREAGQMHPCPSPAKEGA